AVAALDAAVDFGRYDNDGPDDIPNSGDDDGFVDAVVLLHPEVGGECRAVNPASEASIWAHRFFYSGWSRPQPPPRTTGLLTGDARAGGGFIRVDDYIIQGSQGGAGGCSSGLLLSIGTISHETGHLLGLPDLYNTQDGSPGVGRWDLMGSGNERRPDRPAHLSAWSRADLGWVTEVPLTASTLVSGAGPIELNDTAYVVPIGGSDEYFLLENRQQIGSDVHLASPGLLIWHVDSLLMRTRRSSNRVNAQFPNALKLEQADGLENLTGGLVNRGDPGDPFPGSANKTRFAFDTSPAANRNSGAYAGVQVDSIAQVVLGGAMRFRVRFGAPSVVRASDTAALVKVRGVTYAVFRDVLEEGDTATIEIDSVQFSAGDLTRYLFVSWSDGGARRHGITAVLAGATYIATVSRSHRARLAISGAGTVAASPSLDLAAGVLVAEGDSVELLATPAPSNLFTGWSGDTTLADLRLLLRMRRPYTLTASFTEISLDSVVGQLLRGSGLPGVVREAFDAQGNANGRFDLGDFVAWLDRSRTAVPSAVMRRLVERGSQ
ncbi:MAG: immune inhibitor A, partial [Gemmatimonadetes bacterium]|nr:immune inhibitor A [Gemmatimonadota bacterium]